LWSPESVNDVADMYRRLDVISLYLEDLGLTHEKNYNAMLRRLANGRDITALKIFMDAIEPVKRYQRHRVRKYTSYSPLTRIVDAARPDVAAARSFRWRMDAYLDGDASAAEHLKNSLEMWKNNHDNLKAIINKSPVLKEIEPMSEDLSKCADIGLTLLRIHGSDEDYDSQWFKSTFDYFQELRDRKEEIELMILPALEKLARATEKKG
ncbi:MAG: beta-hexosaminidase, partial [candidate division KSB1 bacterium]|nr:beta-hexosaminidase [candidate division KSB1 bacterium]